jgi:hypothetical protein
MPHTSAKVASAEELDHLRQELERARQRLGSDKDKLEWFLNFAEMDLKRLSPTELELLGYTIWAAAGWVIQKGQRPTETIIESVTIKEDVLPSLVAYQCEINKALQALFSDAGIWKCPGEYRIVVYRRSPKGAKEANFEVGYTIASNLGTAMRGFLLALQKAGRYLRSCSRCGKVFVATKRQEYCSANCSQIVRNEKKKRIKEEKKAKESREQIGADQGRAPARHEWSHQPALKSLPRSSEGIHQSRAGKKLYADRDKSGKFNLQTYKPAHGQDIKKKSKA